MADFDAQKTWRLNLFEEQHLPGIRQLKSYVFQQPQSVAGIQDTESCSQWVFYEPTVADGCLATCPTD